VYEWDDLSHFYTQIFYSHIRRDAEVFDFSHVDAWIGLNSLFTEMYITHPNQQESAVFVTQAAHSPKGQKERLLELLLEGHNVQAAYVGTQAFLPFYGLSPDLTIAEGQLIPSTAVAVICGVRKFSLGSDLCSTFLSL
jgi:hypothetical protein